jgi:hypothetical protein
VKETGGGFLCDFRRAMVEAGCRGIARPPEYGGGGLGIAKAVVPGNLVLA